MKERKFPIQAGSLRERREYPHWRRWIWWEIAQVAYASYVELFGHDQSMERMAERGGFGVQELDWLLRRKPWELHYLDPDPNEDCIRAGGNVICEKCGLEYHDHPSHPIHGCLTRVCDGKLVKL